jgi:hypothetical protein
VVIQVEPVEVNGQHWVSVVIDDHETNRHGPYADADAAESVVGRLSRVAHALTGGGDRG